MNFFSRRSFVFAVSLWFITTVLPDARAAGRPPGRTPPTKPADRFVRTKVRIDALLKSRLNPDPLPDLLPNPFQLPAGTNVADLSDGKPLGLPSTKTEPLAPGSDSETLARYAATLKVTGTVTINDRVHLIINQAPYKEGDSIPLNIHSTTVYLLVINIAPGELTLGLNQAVQTIKFKN